MRFCRLLLLFFYLTGEFLLGFGCVTHLCVLFAIQASPPFLLSNREEAEQQIFNDLYNYHINFCSLFRIFENPELISLFKSEVCALGPPPSGELEGPLDIANLHRFF